MLNTYQNTVYYSLHYSYSQYSYSPFSIRKIINKVPDWKQKNILIVEDDETNAYLLKAYLAKTKATIIEVRNGKQAVELCLSDLKIDLVLMDIRLPEMNGYNATQLIKAENKDLPIIAQTAYALDSDIENAMKAGCDDFLAKPISQEELFSVLSKFLY
jgi:two-component system, cell cycle response regulator DivK